MYKFLMVDDEELIRRGFSTRIDWPNAGFEFLDPCENGRDAIEAVEKFHPDVVLTDICMPGADGLAVASHIAENHPDILVVILSGYDEFEYAQKAIRSKVFDYVLKPVSSRDLSVLLNKIKLKLDEERKNGFGSDGFSEKSERSMERLKEVTCSGMLAGNTPGSEEFVSLFGFDPEGLACVACVLEVPFPRENPETDRGEAMSIRRPAESLDSLFRGMAKTIVFPEGESRAVGLIFERSAESCARSAAAAGERFLKVGFEGAVLGLGNPCGDLSCAGKSYGEALAALSYRLVRETERVFSFPDGDKRFGEASSRLKLITERLRAAIKSGGERDVVEEASEFLSALGSADLSPQRIRHELQGLFAQAIDALAEIGLGYESVSTEFGRDFFQYAESLGTAAEAKATFAKLHFLGRELVASRSLNVPEWKILDLKRYVERHYADEGVSVERAAKSLGISSSYLGKLVKRFLDSSFVEYLAEYRVQKAKELLFSTDLMTYEIAERIGYADSRYFGSIFKRHTGKTPSAYRVERRKELGGA